MALDSLFLDTSTLHMKDAIVFKDDKPVLDMMNIRASESWRKAYTRTYTRFFIQEGVPLFK